MEWREQTPVSCQEAYVEAQRWIEAVTKKTFGSNDFRSALENGVLLCDLINKIKPGIIRRVNRLPTPIAGLDNLNVFLKACGKLGLKEAQLFHPGDLQDLSTRVTVKHQETNRRLKNVLISIYWLGRRAHCDRFYDGPYLNFKAFEGLLGAALYKALQESSGQRSGNVRDSGFGESWYSGREELYHLRGGGGGGHRRDDSLDSLDSLGSRPQSVSSDATLKGGSEGCCSDTEADSILRMAENKDTLGYRRSVVITPKASAQFNQFLPSKDKQSGYVPAPLRKKRAERSDDNRRSWANPSNTEDEGALTRYHNNQYTYQSAQTRISTDCYDSSQVSQSGFSAPHPQRAFGYESGSDSDADRPDPDIVLDDLASRRFHSPSPAPPTNFAVPISPLAGGKGAAGQGGPWANVAMTASVVPQQNVAFHRSENVKLHIGGKTQPPEHSSVKVDHRRAVNTNSLFRDMYDDSEDEDDEVGYADPVQDDLYARKMGLKPQPVSNVSYDKFLPKFWTPEEDVHVQKIKLGSQRRPWYKKMQGFSREKSDSSSDDSECDTSPWVSSAPLSSSQPPPHSHAHEASAQTTRVVGKSPHAQPHTPPQLPEIQSPLPETPSLVFAPIDPTSGPRLVKCAKWPLLGRQDPREPPDPFDYESMYPDLENDDMFARRTLAFQSNVDLAMMKTQLGAKRRRYTSEPQLNIVTQQHRHGDTEETDFPDIEQDDVVYRKEKTQQAQQQRPLSGAPDNYAPMPIPEPWALPPELKARLLCPPCPLTQEVAKANQTQPAKELHPETDDMLIRKLYSDQHQRPPKGSSVGHRGPSVPSSCSEDDLQRWRAIREASQLKYRKRLMVERLAALKLSKSTSDIQADPTILRQARYEELQKFREQIKESEDKWQDDLTKWKNRRRSVNSDIVKKKEEREKIEQATYGGDRRSMTFKEMDEDRGSKRKNSIGSRLGSLSYLDDNEDVFVQPISSQSPATPPSGVGPASPPTSHEAETVESPADGHSGSRITATITSASSSSVNNSRSRTAALLQRSEAVEDTSTTNRAEETAIVSSSSLPEVPEPRWPLLETQTRAEAPSSASLHKQRPQIRSMEPKPPGVSQVSASLNQSYQRSDSARITSVVTPRPFGTQSSRITSLPRAFTMDDSHKRVNGDVDVSKKTSVPSRYHQFMTSEDEAQSSSAHSSEEEEEEEETTENSASSVIPHVESKAAVSPAPAEEISQENFCEMRINLNQKPNSSRDFGFLAAWDSTGARVTSIQPGSPAEMCQLQTGDEVLTVNGHQVAGMSYAEWKSSLEEAVQEGSLVMDVRRHGQNNWDRDQPSLPFKSHKTINLTSTDHPTLLGSPETNSVKASLNFTSRIFTETLPTKESPPQPVVDMASNGANGGLREEPVTMRNKESEPMSSKNFKRRSEFFEQGGSDSAMPDISVPAITPSSSRWSWDPEAERRRQEKWQKEQEHLLQEKYKRDQEKLHEEWLKAQQEIATSQQEEVNSHGVSTAFPSASNQQPSASLWEEEERERKEEQERQRQAEERRKREMEERELQRLQEERRRREMQDQEEKRRREEEELIRQRKREEEARKRQEAAEQERREKERALEQQWAAGSQGFAGVQPPLSFTHRLKSKSTPHLEEDGTQRRGAHVQSRAEARWLLDGQLRFTRELQAQSRRAGWQPEQRDGLYAMSRRAPERGAVMGSGVADKKGQQPVSQAELERQLILNEMKKKTPLLTDRSWIRQHSSSTATSKENDAPAMRRGESLDNLDASYNSWRSSWTPRSSSFVQNYSRTQSGNTSLVIGGSGTQRPISSTLPSSYSMGSLRSGAGTHSSPWPRQSPSPSPSSLSPATSPEPTAEAPQQRSRSVSGKKMCTFCDTPLGKGAAMIIESLGLCYHLGCFKCISCKSDLGGSEAGAEVRIRNKQLYCNSCYMRLKTGQPTTM
ncbi:LIM domain only protein 7 [Xenentodon cancila]